MCMDNAAEILQRGMAADKGSHFRYEVGRMGSEKMASEYLPVAETGSVCPFCPWTAIAFGHNCLIRNIRRTDRHNGFDKSVRLPHCYRLAVCPEE